MFNKKNKITPYSIKKNIDSIIEHIAEQDHVTIEIEETKQLVGKNLDKHIKILDKKIKNIIFYGYKDKKINDADSLENAYELMKKIS